MYEPKEVVDIENKDEANESSNPILPTKRKCSSKVWPDFENFKGPNGEYRAKCNHCKKHITGGNGTSHLKSHLNKFLHVVLEKKKHMTLL